MMMMTVKENPTSSSTTQSINRSIEFETMATRPYLSIPPNSNYDYRSHPHPSWPAKPSNYASYSPSTPHVVSSGTGANPSTMKPFHPPSMIHPHFYRRHTESTLSTPFYPTTTPFNTYPHPSGFYYGWNPPAPPPSSFVRTHSATFPTYSPYPSYPVNSTIPQEKPPAGAQHSRSSSTASASASSLPSKVPKRPRLTAQLRHEILKIKSDKPTAFIWEIQQTLLQQGICTSQTLPSTNVIQRVLNESSKSNVKSVPTTTTTNVMKTASPMTICLSPSPSPDLSAEGESMSECSICLESYRSGQEVSILACSHEYHSSCIGEWMLKNRSCPMCRKDIHNQPQFVTLLI